MGALVPTDNAGVPGLEPRLSEPESLVLPITPYPMGYDGRSTTGAQADVLPAGNSTRAHWCGPNRTPDRPTGSNVGRGAGPAWTPCRGSPSTRTAAGRPGAR